MFENCFCFFSLPKPRELLSLLWPNPSSSKLGSDESTDRLTDHHSNIIRIIKRLRTNLTLIISFISSCMLNSLCLRLFDHFSTLFWQTDRQTYWQKMSKEILRAYPTLLMFFVSSSMLKSFCLRLFDNFLTFFWQPDRQTKTPDPRSSEPGA